MDEETLNYSLIKFVIELQIQAFVFINTEFSSTMLFHRWYYIQSSFSFPLYKLSWEFGWSFWEHKILGMCKIDNWNCRLGHANHQVEMTSASQVCSNKISLSLIPPIHLTHTNTHIHTYKHTTCRENKRSRMGIVWYGPIYYVQTRIKEKDRYQEKKTRFQSIGTDLRHFHKNFTGLFGSLLQSLNILRY